MEVSNIYNGFYNIKKLSKQNHIFFIFDAKPKPTSGQLNTTIDNQPQPRFRCEGSQVDPSDQGHRRRAHSARRDEVQGGNGMMTRGEGHKRNQERSVRKLVLPKEAYYVNESNGSCGDNGNGG